VDLDDLVPVGTAPQRRPATGVGGLLVVVDAVNTAPGTAGVLTLGVPSLLAARPASPRARQVRAVSRK
jgi:hypothetical protein